MFHHILLSTVKWHHQINHIHVCTTFAPLQYITAHVSIVSHWLWYDKSRWCLLAKCVLYHDTCISSDYIKAHWSSVIPFSHLLVPGTYNALRPTWTVWILSAVFHKHHCLYRFYLPFPFTYKSLFIILNKNTWTNLLEIVEIVSHSLLHTIWYLAVPTQRQTALALKELMQNWK